MQDSPEPQPHFPSEPPEPSESCTQPAKPRPSLFDLPLELRQEIYKHVFDDLWITYIMDRHPPALLGRHQDSTQGKPTDGLKNALLRTSKQCYAEAKATYLSRRLVKLLAAAHVKPNSRPIHPPTTRLCHGIQRLLLGDNVLFRFGEWPKLPDVRDATIYLHETLFKYDNWKTDDAVRVWRDGLGGLAVRMIRHHHYKIDATFCAAGRFVEAIPREASVVFLQRYSMHGWMRKYPKRGQETWRGDYRFDYRTMDFVELPSPVCLTPESSRYHSPEEGTSKSDAGTPDCG